MYFEYGLAAIEVGCVHHDLAIKATRAEQSPVEDLRTIGGGQDNNTGIGLEAIQLHQQSIESLFPLVVDRTHMDASLPADSVKFVDEYDAGRMLLGLLEQIAHTRGAYSHKHCDEIATADRKKRHFRLAGYRTR